jgi:hypothetical protein
MVMFWSPLRGLVETRGDRSIKLRQQADGVRLRPIGRCSALS